MTQTLPRAGTAVGTAAGTAVAEAPRPEFGSRFTGHMVVTDWTPAGWQPARLTPRGPLPMDPGTVGLHYGQVVFEGLKAYRLADGAVASFRPAAHARRFQRSATRLCMPALPVSTFVDAVDRLLLADGAELPDDPSLSLYLRPIMYASEACLALRPANEYRCLFLAFVTGGFFADRPDPVAVWVSRDHVRAVPGGTGEVKCAGNYAPAYAAQRVAAEHGCQQVIWLDAVQRRWVEEMGGMNLFFVRGRGRGAEVVTPRRTGALLPGVTRDSLLVLAERLGYRPRKEQVSIEDWRDGCASGEITESFACGTAAVVTPIGVVRDGDREWTVGDGHPGPVTLALREALVERHRGLVRDPDGWLRRPPGAAPARVPVRRWPA